VLFERRTLGARERSVGALRLAGLLGYFVRNFGVKVAMRRGWLGAVRLLGHHEEAYRY